MKRLRGIDDAVADLIKDEHIFRIVFPNLRKVSGVRQCEIAGLLVCAANYSGACVALVTLG